MIRKRQVQRNGPVRGLRQRQPRGNLLEAPFSVRKVPIVNPQGPAAGTVQELQQLGQAQLGYRLRLGLCSSGGSDWSEQREKGKEGR